MNRYQYKDLIIEVFDDPIYSFNSTDNKVNYSKCYFGKDAREYHTSKHGIIIRRGNQEISSCLVVGSGGATGIYQRSTLVDKDELLICCCDTIFCLTIPNLDIKWNVQADKVTCFELYKLQNDYIIYGECQITRITCDGQIKWQFDGDDIFVSLYDDKVFKLEKDHIKLTDFGRTKYNIDFDGKLMKEGSKQMINQEKTSTLVRFGWNWWQKLFINL